MELRELKALITLMQENGLVELEIEDKKGKVRLVRASAVPSGKSSTEVSSAESKAGSEVSATPGRKKIPGKTMAPSITEPLPGIPELQPNEILIESPMVGTFYRASSPETPPFVEEGSYVQKGQPLCLIEAMKMMNEIEADTAGRVVRILVENGAPVQYGQPLMVLAVG